MTWNIGKNNYLTTFIVPFRKKVCLSIYSTGPSYDSKSSRTSLYKPCTILIKIFTLHLAVNSFPKTAKYLFSNAIYKI